MIQTILNIIQVTPGREAYWPRHLELYGHQIGFLIYISAIIAVVIVLIGIYRALRVWFHGKYDEEDQKFLSFFISLILKVFKNLFSRNIPKRIYYGIGAGITKRKTMQWSSFIVHAMIMLGFLGAAIATIILTIHEWILHEQLLVGPLYLIHSFFADLAGFLLFMGVILALIRRYIMNRDYYDRAGYEDLFLLLLLLWISISGFFMEATRIVYGLVNEAEISFEIFSFIGYPLAIVLQTLSPSNGQIFALHLFFYLSHLFVAFIGAIYIAHGKFFHIGVGLGNIMLNDMHSPAGQLQFDPEGIKAIEDFTFYQLFEASACMKCHFCHNYCPAQDSGEPLSPLKIIQDVKNWGRKQYGLIHSNKNVPIIGETSGITSDVLWACVTCYACVNACPHLIGHINMIVGMRAALIESGEIPSTFTAMLESVYNYGNVWSQPKRDRTKWFKEGELPKIKKSESKLLWLPGDTLAYDPRNQKVARATYDILTKAEVDYGTFLDAEKNDGNEMRRLGEEALFQMLAEENIKMFKKRKVQRIVCSSPHAFNTIKNEYPEFGGEFDVVHITQFLLELIETEGIQFTKELNYEVTYHDPCYLGRYNDVYDAPRKIIEHIPGVQMKEMPNHGQFSYCCGGGGGGMFKETPEWVEMRISERRVLEAKETLDSKNSTKKVLITACPFCTSMLTDALKTQQLEEEIEVLDIIELVQEAMGEE
ncbi:MAG: heterodisulfide reductase-related iron-sulfur binding cluster [Candidatus Hodarchaeota archaeon]